MHIQKGSCVYILTSSDKTVLYVGVTSDLHRRIKEHINKLHPSGFTAAYNCTKLVWYEQFSQIAEAIDFEKKIKAGNRKKKIALIEATNPEWEDLFEVDVRFW